MAFNGCDDGYYPVPKSSAPKRFSLQTGIICGLFNTAHPLCKWVDEILPSLPIADEFKDVGKQIARRIRQKIGSKSYQTLVKIFGDLNQVNKIMTAFADTNQFIEDLENTINGGEVITEQFCYAGLPDFPEPINWGEVFLAFSGIYPNFLIDKISGIIAYEKFIEYCECRKIKYLPDPPEVTDDALDIPTFAHNLFDPNCSDCFSAIMDFINQSNLPAKNLTAEKAIQIQKDRLCLDADICVGQNEVQAVNLLFDPSGGEIRRFDEAIGESVYRGNSPFINCSAPNSGCCAIFTRSFMRQVDLPRFNYQIIYNSSEIQYISNTYIIINDPTDWSLSELANELEYWQYPFRQENTCSQVPNYEPFDPTVIEDVDPTLDPCNSEFVEEFPDLLKNCNPCEGECVEEVATVRIYDCNTKTSKFEDRTLLAN